MLYCSWWGEPCVLMLDCLRQHTKDRRLMHRLGCHKGEAWGCTPDQMSKFVSDGTKAHAEPHPLFLGGRSPHYWVCGEYCLLCLCCALTVCCVCAAHANNVGEPNRSVRNSNFYGLCVAATQFGGGDLREPAADLILSVSWCASHKLLCKI